MNFKKIVIGSVAALMATTPLLAMAEHTRPVQAASTENKKEKGTLDMCTISSNGKSTFFLPLEEMVHMSTEKMVRN